MKLKNVFHLINKPWFRKIAVTGSLLGDYLPNKLQQPEFEKNKEIFYARKKRVLDAISMRKEPDRVPVSVGGLNFFPAKYAGITCAEYMFDLKKAKAAFFKMCGDFNFDLTFPSFMLSMGRIMTAADLNLVKLPGRELNASISFQYNEIERLKSEEYDDFLKDGFEFLINTIAPRASGMFKLKGTRKMAHITRTMLEAMKFMNNVKNGTRELKTMGQYNMFTSSAFPPLDIVSFAFRDLTGLAKDMLRKKTRDKLIELCERMEPWLTSIFSFLTEVNEEKGIWFTSERAFSLSPRQFEAFYWPTLKKMIVSFVKRGNIPFLVWESDVTHLVHYLLELPKSISRRCVFMCDNSDIFEVNRILDGHMCISGNVPLSTMCVGTPKDVEKYLDKTFAELKPGGGFINCPALGIPDEAKIENVHALINYTHKHGKYT